MTWISSKFHTAESNSANGTFARLGISSFKVDCCCCCWIASVVSDSVWPRRWQPTRLPHPWDSPGKNTGVGCHFLLQCMKVKSEREVAQSCPTLSDPMDCSLPGSSVHEIFQARVLEWGAIAFSESRLRKCNNLSQKTIHLDGILQLCNINTKVCSPVKNHYHLWDLSWCNSHCMVNLKENTCDILTETQLAADGWLRRNWKKC